MHLNIKIDIKLLEDSFAQIRPQAKVFASSFYNNLFTDYPQLQPLFAHTSMEEQEKKLMISLALVINNLRNLAYLTSILKDLGQRHLRYNTRPEYYPMVGAALLKTLEYYSGTAWTPELKKAWINGYQAIVSLMLEGKDLK